MKLLSKKAATLFGENMTKVQYDGSSSNGYVRSTACGGGADF
ncbi:unknown [Clostridium sp. CAG:729]|nr:unknown [Clostridium sp. CAG:729]